MVELIVQTAYGLYPSTYYKLEQWSDYMRNAFNLGYPTMSTEQMAIEGGGIDTRGSGAKIEIVPQHIQEVDDAMLSLKNSNRQHFDAIQYYFQKGSITYMWKKAGFKNRHKAREGLNMAVAWIDSRLT